MDTSRALTLRPGKARDVPAVLALLDGAVDWLTAQGLSGQWGTRHFTDRPRAVELVEEYFAKGEPWVAELDGRVVGSMTLREGPGPSPGPAPEPERSLHFLVSDRSLAGHGIGAALVAHAVAEARRAGAGLLRVDCYAGDDGRLVDYYVACGFRPAERFDQDGWPGQVLTIRLDDARSA
ncbi:GNAT family N-acetyltransferase [Streptomyces sp. NPDC004959]|uniref:GNAT family N-acetyltransferase n=1 Tax=unclassified Streptomyces TaxID=2593676 RepID=UPI0004C9A200|nr:GNAT family N-acetyltransferase [Streptomyces sp. NRRL F-5630]